MQKKDLDVKKMIAPILRNYDEHVLNFIRMLHTIDCILIYDGPDDVHSHILDRKVYACSVSYRVQKKSKILKSIFPVMIGSRLDRLIRHTNIREFTLEVYTQFLSTNDDTRPFEPLDIVSTSFLILGSPMQLPYFFTNDPTRTHVVKNSIVRCYSYDTEDRGKEISFYIDSVDDRYERGDLVVTCNDGSKTPYYDSFFSHCPYPIDPIPYMLEVYNLGSFDIDHLANKMIISPGHLFVKLFVKYLYVSLKKKEWADVKTKLAMIVRSIETGNLLHVLSRKTHYYKESESGPKMVRVPTENYCELGMDGKKIKEKIVGCWRRVNMNTFPLNPHYAYLIVRQISSKVKSDTAISYHPSYVSFLCQVGGLETKNTGRTQFMTRDTYVSTYNDLEPVAQVIPGEKLYSILNLQIDHPSSAYKVVVNEACISVTESCFRSIDLFELKRTFRYIECYQQQRFIHIRLKVGLIFKKVSDDLWTTPQDQQFWIEKIYGAQNLLIDQDPIVAFKLHLAKIFGYDYLTSYLVDFNPHFHHSSFAKIIWAFNALKNAILATERTYNLYFWESFSSHSDLSKYHEVVCKPVDSFSEKFALKIPRVTVAYMSFQGNNQEDSIVVREDLRAFDCFRFYTLRLVFPKLPKGTCLLFRPTQGEGGSSSSSNSSFLGSVISSSESLEGSTAQSVHLKLVYKNPKQIDLYFKKEGFEYVQHHLTNSYLLISIERFHKASMGDKLCSFFGQKGLTRFSGPMPEFDEEIQPDLILNPYCLFRMTPGQIIEAVVEGQDAKTVRNSEGKLIPGASVFYGKTYYFSVGFIGKEHIYIPVHYVKDKVLNQPVKGRSREGGMRIGTMEANNGFRGNGTAFCHEEKFGEHSDRIKHEDVMVPKSALLCAEDAKFFKMNLGIAKTNDCIVEEEL